ncbi:MAG: carbohydrate ABC transporter permease [Bacteroidota bacterium]
MKNRATFQGITLSLPYLIFASIFVVFPLVFSAYLVLHRWDGMSSPIFVGFKNLARLIRDELFYRSIFNTLIFLLINVPFQIAFALLFAVLLNSVRTFRGILRAIYFAPVVVSGVVVTIIWQQLYSYDYGVLNTLLSSLGLHRIPWLTSPSLAMPSIAVMATWKNVGLFTVLFLVGLQEVPQELYEASVIDGANAWKRFFKITLPILGPTMVLVVILSTINGFSLFVEPYIMTGGGPMNSTMSTLLYIYNQAFYFGHFGYAAALGLFYAVVIFAVVVLQRKVLKEE